jgi:hypothetical protein
MVIKFVFIPTSLREAEELEFNSGYTRQRSWGEAEGNSTLCFP